MQSSTACSISMSLNVGVQGQYPSLMHVIESSQPIVSLSLTLSFSSKHNKTPHSKNNPQEKKEKKTISVSNYTDSCKPANPPYSWRRCPTNALHHLRRRYSIPPFLQNLQISSTSTSHPHPSYCVSSSIDTIPQNAHSTSLSSATALLHPRPPLQIRLLRPRPPRPGSRHPHLPRRQWWRLHGKVIRHGSPCRQCRWHRLANHQLGRDDRCRARNYLSNGRQAQSSTARCSQKSKGNPRHTSQSRWFLQLMIKHSALESKHILLYHYCYHYCHHYCSYYCHHYISSSSSSSGAGAGV